MLTRTHHFLPLSSECWGHRFGPACQTTMFLFLKICFHINFLFLSLLLSSPLPPSLSHVRLFLSLLFYFLHLISHNVGNYLWDYFLSTSCLDHMNARTICNSSTGHDVLGSEDSKGKEPRVS